MAPGSIIPIIIAAHQAKVRRVLTAFRTAGATSPERARTCGAVGVAQDDIFAELEQHGVLRPGPAMGTYYLDEVAHAARARRQGRGTKVVLIVMLVILLAGLLVLLFVRPTVI